MGKWPKRTVEEWSAIFDAQAGSGRSASKYCREHEISYKQFLYCRRKVRNGHKAQSLTIAEAGSRSVLRREGFVPVAVKQGPAMKLKFPRGLVVESDGMLSASWVVEAAERWLRMGG
jgi:hypothetical protein